ncbi:MAG TPA: hypothetical protein VF984_09770 [Actinomycetota bacterium]
MATRIRSFLAGALVVGLIAFVTGGTYSAFFSRTSNGDGTGNRFSAGTVHLVDNDSGSLMFNMSGMRPTDAPRTSCITVTYNGSLDAAVHLYGTVSSTGVEQYINLKIEVGTTTTGFGDCSGFSASQTLFDATLSGFAAKTDWTSGLIDPLSPWTTGQSRAYRFTVSLQNTSAAQGRTATVSFSWEARNL